jgi:hypothetical protein
MLDYVNAARNILLRDIKLKEKSNKEQKWRHVSSWMEHRLLMHIYYTFLSVYLILSVPQTALILSESELLKFAFMHWRMRITDKHRKYSVFIHLSYTKTFLGFVDRFMKQLNKYVLGKEG